MTGVIDISTQDAKDALFALVPLLGLDVDGDILSVNGISYYVNIRTNSVSVVGKA